jgi:hypothetical protein
VPLNPRNPQQQSSTGQAKDDRAKGSTMRTIPSIGSLLFALLMLAMSAVIVRASQHFNLIRPAGAAHL